MRASSVLLLPFVWSMGAASAQVAGPTGEIVSPRASARLCFSNLLPIELRAAHPAGARLTATVRLADVVVAQHAIDTHADGSPVDVSWQENIAGAPEGRLLLTVHLDDGQGGQVDLDAGGRLRVDRTPPIITLTSVPGNVRATRSCFQGDDGLSGGFISEVDDPGDGGADLHSFWREADGCGGRRERMTATDLCGNSTDLFISNAQGPVSVVIDGPAEDDLLAQAAPEWRVVGLDACDASVGATLGRDGGMPEPFVSGTIVDAPGEYVLAVGAHSCFGQDVAARRRFAINAPPVAVVRPGLRQVRVGHRLILDAQASRPPERQDRIVRFAWDLDGDGVFETESPRVELVGQGVGDHPARLQVTDTLGLTGETDFVVTVVPADDAVADAAPADATTPGDATLADADRPLDAVVADRGVADAGRPADSAVPGDASRIADAALPDADPGSGKEHDVRHHSGCAAAPAPAPPWPLALLLLRRRRR